MGEPGWSRRNVWACLTIPAAFCGLRRQNSAESGDFLQDCGVVQADLLLVDESRLHIRAARRIHHRLNRIVDGLGRRSSEIYHGEICSFAWLQAFDVLI